MKPQEIRDLTTDEIKRRLVTTEEELVGLRMQFNTKQLENPMKIREARRQLARLKTILRQKETAKKEG